MLVIRNILLIIHIIAAGLWVSSFAVEMILRGVRQSQKGTPAELSTLVLHGRLLSTMGGVAGPSILLTGIGLIFTSPYVLGGAGVIPAWLIIKIIIYVILLGLVFGVVQPTAKKVYPAFAMAAQNATSVTPEVWESFKRFETISFIHTALVVINIALAVWKPT